MVAIVALLGAGAGATAPPGSRDGARVVLLVHGFKSRANTDCGAAYDPMIAQLRRAGLSVTMVRVGFYSGDRHCDVDLRSYGHFGDDSSWRIIAKAFSKYVHTRYTAKGVSVDVVGYSMGGLIARGAVYGAQRGDPGFSKVDVEDAVTLGTPHKGAAWYTGLCMSGQCASFKPGAPDLLWLNGDGNPQGVDGTDWTTIGSRGDSRVPAWSATAMTNATSARVVYRTVRHTGPRGYLADTAVITRVGLGLVTPER